jgi:acyl-CoA thioester hydrolase
LHPFATRGRVSAAGGPGIYPSDVEAYRHPLTPRYLEIDRQGVVFNAWYLAYFDDAMTGFLAARGLPYTDLIAGGLDVMLVHTELDWTGGLGYGDAAHVEVGVETVGRTSFTLGFDVVRDGASLCRGRTVYVLVGAADNTKQPIPDHVRALLHD